MSDGTITKLPARLKLGWASGAFGIAMLFNGIIVLSFFYLISIAKIDPALVGTLIFAAKLLGAVTDPWIGAWSDRLISAKGRRRPFLLWGAFICAASYAMIFSVPLFEEGWMRAAYAFFALCVYTLGYSAYNVPYLAMPAEMTDDYHERSAIHSYRIVMVTTGGFVAAAVAPKIIERLGNSEWSSYASVSWVVAGLMLVSLLIAYFTTADARFTSKSEAQPNAFRDLKAVFANRHFRWLFGAKFAQLSAIQCAQAAMAFFIIQSMKLTLDVFFIFGIATTITSVLAAPMLVRLSKAQGKRAAWYISAGAYVLYVLSWLLAAPGEPDWAIAARAALVGVATTGNIMLAMSMLTDVINQDAKESGLRREGSYTAVYSFIEKITGALGPLIVGWGLSLAGFNTKLPPMAPQPGDVQGVLIAAMAWVPAALGIIAMLFMAGYKLDQKAMEGE